jgi:hypothetical protein
MKIAPLGLKRPGYAPVNRHGGTPEACGGPSLPGGAETRAGKRRRPRAGRKRSPGERGDAGAAKWALEQAGAYRVGPPASQTRQAGGVPTPQGIEQARQVATCRPSGPCWAATPSPDTRRPATRSLIEATNFQTPGACLGFFFVAAISFSAPRLRGVA